MTNKLSRKRTNIQLCAGVRGFCLGGGSALENPAARHRSLGGKGQHGGSLLWLITSPLNCSRVIFKTSASKSPLERLSQTFFRRRARSFRRQSSLLSGLSESKSSEFEAAAARARINLSVIDILPHLAAEAWGVSAEAERCRRLRLCCLAKWASDSVVMNSKDAATRRSRMYLGVGR
jgi:hypothetical protein